MHLSRILCNAVVVFAGLSLAYAQIEPRAARFTVGKRDLLSNLIGTNNNNPPAQLPAAPASPTADSATKPGGVGPIPSLLNGVLSPPPGGGGTPVVPTVPAVVSKKPPLAGDDTTGAGVPSPTGPTKEISTPEQTSLSPGLVAVVVVVLVSLLVAILFSCYRIRQSRQRRHRNLDEDILKNHAGSVGYSEGGGYGMYVGHKESPDLWRKNLDLFHRG